MTNFKTKQYMKTTLQLAVILSFYLFSNFFELNAQSWNRAGNAGTNPATDFVGTTDNVSLKIKTNNTTRINVTSTGKVAIGSNTPMFKLDVQKGSINTDSCYRIGGNTVLSIKNAAGYVNTYCGQYAGLNDTAYSNTYVGLYSGYINSSGYQNTYLGSNSGTYSTGSSNVFMGFGAGYYCSGDHNTLVGKEAGGNCFGNNNSFFGSEAGLNTT